MKLDRSAQRTRWEDIADAARLAEEEGYDGIFSTESTHDPFLPLMLAAEHSRRLDLMTSIAVAFARNPMTLAVTAHDLHRYSGERFVLGLGSQVKAHIERRFSMEWSHPAARMREMILAIRAIWRSWDEGEKLDFKGDFYTHTLMTPYFDPGPNRTPPRVFLAGVGERMTEVAGEVADGFLCHALTTPEFLRQRTLPALRRGLERAGRPWDGFEVAGPVFVATGADEQRILERAEAIRTQIGFYASTPAYEPVLALHGWSALGDELRALTRADRWGELGRPVDDEVLHAFAIIATPEELPGIIAERYAGVLHRITYVPADELAPDRKRALLQAIAAI
jgi:probable F420-dependent oxidoreductase